jgi:hypothetical protein
MKNELLPQKRKQMRCDVIIMKFSLDMKDETKGRYTAKIVDVEKRSEMEEGKGSIVTVRSH